MAPRRGLMWLLVAAALLALGVLSWSQQRRVEQAENDVGLAASRAISAVFSRADALKVGELNGEVLARVDATSMGGMVRNEQVTRAPYSVDYFVQLGRMPVSAFRWNEPERTMFVEIPPVSAGPPNVDMSKVQTRQSGFYISRKAGIAMQQQSAQRLAGAAARKANDPRFIAQARDNATAAVTRLIQAPLAAAGLGEVRVEVRFAGDPLPAGERWDMSRPLEDVLRDTR